MYIENNGVVLRDFRQEDIENKVRWINDSKNNQYLHYDLPLEFEKTLTWYLNKNNNTRLDCVIEYNGVPVGLIGLLNIDQIHKKAEYYISMGDTTYKRKRIAYRASEAILEYAFERLELNKVYLNVDKENTAARCLYEKLDFKVEGMFVQDMMHCGRLIDRVRYAFFQCDWKERTLDK